MNSFIDYIMSLYIRKIQKNLKKYKLNLNNVRFNLKLINTHKKQDSQGIDKIKKKVKVKVKK